MIECVDHMQNFFQKLASKQFQKQSFKFNDITATFDLAELVKDAIDPYGECYMGLNAYTGMKNLDLTTFPNTQAEKVKRLIEEAPVVTKNLSPEAKSCAPWAWTDLCAIHRSRSLRIRQVLGVR